MPVDKIVLIAIMLIPIPYNSLKVDVAGDIAVEQDTPIELLDENFRSDNDDENYTPGQDGEEYRMSKEDFEDSLANKFHKNEFRGG
jgi:hypothetical protein